MSFFKDFPCWEFRKKFQGTNRMRGPSAIELLLDSDHLGVALI